MDEDQLRGESGSPPVRYVSVLASWIADWRSAFAGVPTDELWRLRNAECPRCHRFASRVRTPLPRGMARLRCLYCRKEWKAVMPERWTMRGRRGIKGGEIVD